MHCEVHYLRIACMSQNYVIVYYDLLFLIYSVSFSVPFLFFLVKVPAHHSAPSSAALAEDFRAVCIQAISPRVQVSTRVRTCIPYWRALLGGRCRGSSVTPFQFILIIDCQPHPTSHCRWPSFPGRCCSFLEQSAWSCHFRTFCSSLPVPA